MTDVPAAAEDALRTDAERFLDHLTVERGLSTNTLQAYRRDLRRYLAFLSSWGIRDVPGVTDEAVGAYVVQLTSSTHDDGALYRPASVARMLSAVRTFHRFELREGVTDHDPTVGIVHYCVGNMPGAVPRTSTYALTNVTLPYVLEIATLGLEDAVRADPALALGVNAYRGRITNTGVAGAHGLEAAPLHDLIDGLG